MSGSTISTIRATDKTKVPPRESERSGVEFDKTSPFSLAIDDIECVAPGIGSHCRVDDAAVLNFRSAPLKVLTIATMSPSCVS